MDIDFFNDTGNGFGGNLPGHVGGAGFSFETTDTESCFDFILAVRGFVDGLVPTDAEARCKAEWEHARQQLPDPWKTTPYDPLLTLPVGTRLDLFLRDPLASFWGKAKLENQSINAARKEIERYLKPGRCKLAHAGGVSLLNHIANKALRDSMKITFAAATDLDTPATGDLFFRATPMPTPAIPSGPNEHGGKTQIASWVDALETHLAESNMALSAANLQAKWMDEDLAMLDTITVVLDAIFDIGRLGVYRSGTLEQHPDTPIGGFQFPNAGSLGSFARKCYDNLVRPASPGNVLGFAWALADTEYGTNVVRVQKSNIEHYKALAKDYKDAPAAHLGLVTRACDLELQLLEHIVHDGDKKGIAAAQLASANQYLGTGSGDAPEAAGGVGVLLSMSKAKVPDGVPIPGGLLRLEQGVPYLRALLKKPSDPSIEGELKNSIAKILELSGDALQEFTKKDGWAYLISASGVKKEATAGVRVVQLPETALKKLAKLSDAGKARFDTGIAWLRAVGFLASGVNLIDDALKVANAVNDHGDVSDDLEKLIKDMVSTYGSIARDYAKTRLVLQGPFLKFSPEAQARFTAWAKKDSEMISGGNLLGVASGIWTAYNGGKEKDALLWTGGLANTLGYGLRILFEGAKFVEISTLPLLVIGAGLELWSATRPPAADAAVKEQTMAMVNGVTKKLGDWHAKGAWLRWRKTSPAFETELENIKKSGAACADSTDWTTFLPFDSNDDKQNPGDVQNERARFREIGFRTVRAEQLVPDEGSVQLWGRTKVFGPGLIGSKPPWLSPPRWPPAWPILRPRFNP